MTDQSIEQEIQAKGLTAPRVTPADIEANITSTFYFTAAQGAEKAARDNGSYAAGSPAEGLASQHAPAPRTSTLNSAARSPGRMRWRKSGR